MADTVVVNGRHSRMALEEVVAKAQDAPKLKDALAKLDLSDIRPGLERAALLLEIKADALQKKNGMDGDWLNPLNASNETKAIESMDAVIRQRVNAALAAEGIAADVAGKIGIIIMKDMNASAFSKAHEQLQQGHGLSAKKPGMVAERK